MARPTKKKSNPVPTKQSPADQSTALISDQQSKEQRSCPVVGIGASAGGLAAFKAFFSQMPDDNGMAFVLVPHLDPTHPSLMSELLSRQTGMPVCEASDGMAVEANHVYIIPPAKYLTLVNGKLLLSEPPGKQKIETAIDHFLKSLAMDRQQKAIGIILSGTSSHGTDGLLAIKATDGMTMAQRPDSAEYASMPQNAIDSGIVDYILPPAEMPTALLKYVHHAYISGAWASNEETSETEQLERVLRLLMVHTKYDFRNYRKNMIKRRIQRRMGLNYINQLSDYCELLSARPQEAKLLLRDLLIGVTGFFREPEAFRVLEQQVIPQWIARKEPDTAIRIWIPGCASGEEAYSIAMLVIECYTAAQQPLKLQIFASDIDETALDIARHGIYPVSIASDISSERLKRFFTQTGSHYQVCKQLRESVVFANQNLINDAPFSKLDLISCRNLLIYLESELQQKVISLFHFALKPGGFLLLGSSETVGRQLDLFEPLSKKWRIFRRIGLTRRDIVDFPITALPERRGLLQPTASLETRREMNFAELTQRQLLNDYAPAAVLINRKYEVLYFQGPTGDFLEAPTGEPTRDLIAMARQGLQTKLRAACYKAIREDKTVTDNSPRLRHNDSWRLCSITVKPINEPKQAEGLLLVTFQPRESTSPAMASSEASPPFEESSLVRQLEYELKATRDDLQSSIEDMNSSNEELKASNEEIMSMNEELQSANEELETSKEELQSLNEELSTVNNQLQDKLEELDKSHNDMANLLNSSDIATLFLDTQLNIRQFTPSTGKLLGLLKTDIGRPISTFATDFTGASLLTDARQVLDKLSQEENILPTSDGRHFLRRTLPYRTSDNRIEGLVISFIDMTQRFAAEQQARRMATVLQDSNDAITVFDLQGHFTAWNRGAIRLYGYTEEEALSMNITDIVPPERQDEEQQYLQRIAHNEQIGSFDSVRISKSGHSLNVWITVTPLHDESGRIISVSTTERDLSERLQLQSLREVSDRLLHLVEHLPVAAVYIENNILQMNKAAEQLTGYKRDELSTLDLWFDRLFGDQKSEIRRQYEQDRSAEFPRKSGPMPLRQQNGDQRFIEFAGYRYDDHEIWILHDVTQHHEYELRILDREQRLRAVMDTAAEAIVVIDVTGSITDFNVAAVKLFGYSADEVIRRNVKLLMPSPYSETHDGYIANYLKVDKPRPRPGNMPRELPGRHKDGHIVPLQLTVTEIDHQGIFVCNIRDLTEQKRLERQIAEISTLEQERIGQEIHDGLGQQLTGLSMMAASLKGKLDHPSKQNSSLLNEIIKQLQQAIKDTRTLSRGLVPVPVTPEGLKDALQILAEDVSNNMGVDCRLDASSTIEIKDRTSAMQIYRIAQEAVNNAIKHAKPSHINIHLGAGKTFCELCISDDGGGFNLNKVSPSRMGIRIMRYRAGIIGCNLEITSAPGKGTSVCCTHSSTIINT